MPDDSTSSQQQPATEITRVSIRIPPFWPEKPKLWFCQLEGQFNLNNITQDTTKFWYVISQLDTKFAQEVEDIITSPPEKNKYDAIKSELINRLSTSKQLRLKQLLEHEEIGDRTPSQFLRHLRNLASDAVQDEFLRTLWLNRLPGTMQAILATQSDLSLAKIAEIADKIKETASASQIHATSQAVSTPTHEEIADLKAQVRQLSLQIAEFSRERPRDRRPADRNRSSSRYEQRKDNTSSAETQRRCWYHRRYGASATKCRSPCSYQAGNESNRH